MLLLKAILNRMSEVSLKNAKAPEHALEEGEKVVGTMSDDLKRLYIVMDDACEELESVGKKSAAWIESFEGEELPKDEDERKKREFLLLSNECRTAYTCFWNSLHHEFPETLREDVAVRKDWQVVIIDRKAKFKSELLALVETLFS